jgi:hypothetical protein
MNRHVFNGKLDETGRAAPAAQNTTRRCLRDAVALAELQWRLLELDLKEGLRTARAALAVLLAGTVLALACIPVGLLGTAALLAERTPLAIWQAILVVFAGAILVALGCMYGGWRGMLRQRDCLNRSRMEWRQNVTWVKDVLQHPGGDPLESCGQRLPREEHA